MRGSLLAPLLSLAAACAPSAPFSPPQEAADAARAAVEGLMEIEARALNARPALEEIARDLMAACYEEMPASPAYSRVEPEAVEVVDAKDAGGGAVLVRLRAGGRGYEARSMPQSGGGWKVDRLRRECRGCDGKDEDCPECEGTGYAPFLHAVLPRRAAAGAAADPSKLDWSEPEAAARSLIALRGEARRRARPVLEELHEAALDWARDRMTAGAAKALAEELSRTGEEGEVKVVHREPDRRRAIMTLGVPRVERRATEEIGRVDAVRVRLRKVGDDWRIQEEALYCPDCASHRACDSCDSTGIMRGHGHLSPCSGCRADGDCARCGGAGYLAGYSVLRVR
jgi:hypothetical protein